MDVQERRDVTLVEQTDVAQVDWLLEQHRMRNHAPVDVVPCGPHILPLLNRRQSKGSRRLSRLLEQREHELRALEKP